MAIDSDIGAVKGSEPWVELFSGVFATKGSEPWVELFSGVFATAQTGWNMNRRLRGLSGRRCLRDSGGRANAWVAR